MYARLIVVVILVLALSSVAVAEPPAIFSPTPPAKPAPSGIYQGGGRVGGDTVTDAVVIPGIPFTDAGNTCGFANNYDEVCPYTGSTAPDVVYSYAPSADGWARVDLCASSYDTKVYIWEDVVGNVVACNDDANCGYSGYQSKINVALAAGHTYYLVIDGYGDSCGDYALSVTEYPPCTVQCPAGGVPEGEPPCQDGYQDDFNGGCIHGWSPLVPGPGDCTTICGKACTFVKDGHAYRDVDYYDAVASGGTVTATCTAEFPLMLFLVYVPVCSNMQYITQTVDECETATLSWDFAPGDELWVIAGPSVFFDVPEGDYTLEVCGITNPVIGACCTHAGCMMSSPASCEQHGGTWMGDGTDCSPDPCSPPTPVERTTWGRIKSGYR
jgi:hypothetical protein